MLSETFRSRYRCPKLAHHTPSTYPHNIWFTSCHSVLNFSLLRNPSIDSRVWVSAACRVGSTLGRLFWECEAQPVSVSSRVSQESGGAELPGTWHTGHWSPVAWTQQWHCDIRDIRDISDRHVMPRPWDPARGKMSPIESGHNKVLGILLLLLHIDVSKVECQKGFINFPVSNPEGKQRNVLMRWHHAI